MKNERDFWNASWFMWALIALTQLAAIALLVLSMRDGDKPSPFGEGGSGTVVSAPMPAVESSNITSLGHASVPLHVEPVKEPLHVGTSGPVRFAGWIALAEVQSWVQSTDLSIAPVSISEGPSKLVLQCGIEINLKTGAVHIPADLTLDEASRKFWENLTAAFPGVR